MKKNTIICKIGYCCLMTATLLFIMHCSTGLMYAQLPDKLPDLTITGLTWEPAEPEVGDSVWFRAEIKNIGEGPSPSEKTHGIRFRVDDGIFAWNADHKSSMQPGDVFYATPDPTSSAAGGFWVVGAPGVYEISVEVDDYCEPTHGPTGPSYCTQNIDPKCNKRICESNEYNNFFYVTFTITGEFVCEEKPDLITTDITMVPENPVVGDDVVFSAFVKNQGDKVATSTVGYFGVTFLFGETRVTRTAFDAMITSLEPGESKKLSANWSLPESGSSNGAWKAVAGDTIVTAVVDREDNVVESIETNNSFSKTLYINVHDSIKTADLILENIYFDPPDPIPYQLVFMSAAIINQGPVYTMPIDKDRTIKTDFILSGINISRTIREQSISDSIPAGDTIIVYGNQVDYNLELDGGWYSKNPGDYFITGATDSWANNKEGHIIEKDDDNNSFQKRLTVMPPADGISLPDLEVTDLTWEPVEPVPGDSITFTVNFKNAGEVPVPANRLYKARITAFDTTITARSYYALAVGESTNLHFDKIRIPLQVTDNMVTIALDTFPWFSVHEAGKINNVLTREISSLKTGMPDIAGYSYIKIYPVPATSHLYIDYQAQKDETLHVRMMNLVGLVVIDRVWFASPGYIQMVIPTGELTGGIYCITIQTDEKSISAKTMIQP